tara:strand:- start:595 stop:1638 length:1044 start_codon:yes stop_codon:yes gene_type:complete
MSTFADQLLNWYDTHRRSLPWRALPGQTPVPYHVWLSEIMLQQTTVATVKAYYKKFLLLWPTVEALAAAPQETVLKEWAGLGYYARARNLHKCAQIITADYGGEFPNTEVTLRALPGIGDYTAAAIAAIAFHEPAAVIDGNIERIISRNFRIKTPLPSAKKEIKAEVAKLTPSDRSGDFAQAMMDLGASLCSPKKPSCLLCPIANKCAAQKAGDMETYPIKAPKKIKPVRRAVSFWLEHDGHILLERRPQKGLLGGMPGLFSTEWNERDTFPNKAEWLAKRPSEDYFKAIEGEAKHTFTHFHLLTQLVAAKAATKHNIENGFWHPAHQLEDVGLPTVFAKIAQLTLT